jgi:peptide/nickel transport system permease protein
MTDLTLSTPAPVRLKQAKGESPSAQARRAFMHNTGAVIALAALVAIILSALFASWLTPYDPLARNADIRLMPPSLEHPFGTDALGRDILARALYGGRISLQVGFFSMIVSLLLGVPLGLVAGYLGGRVDNIIMRIVELILAFPGLILAIWLVAMLGASINNVIIAISIGAIPTYARITRGIALSTRAMDYVVAAQSMGAHAGRILLIHILPSVVGPLIVLATLSISSNIVAGASLSFLGLGVRPPTPEWGAMLADGRGYMRNAWWMSAFPGLLITLVVLAANIVGDGIRDALDPKTRAR